MNYGWPIAKFFGDSELIANPLNYITHSFETSELDMKSNHKKKKKQNNNIMFSRA